MPRKEFPNRNANHHDALILPTFLPPESQYRVNKHTHAQHLTTPLLGDTDGATAAASGLGVLATDAEAPVVPETTVSPDLLQPLEVVAELGVDAVGEGLAVLAVDDVLLPVKEPGGDLVLRRVLLRKTSRVSAAGGHTHSLLGALTMMVTIRSSSSEVSSPALMKLLAQSVPGKIGSYSREFVPLGEIDIGLLEDKVGVLRTLLARVSKIAPFRQE